MIYRILHKIGCLYHTYRKRSLEKDAKSYLDRYNLMKPLNEIRERSNSTGVSLMDYACLYDFVKENRPRYFLECGTGVSTHIIARAMKSYCYDHYSSNIKLVSMESDERWYQEAIKLYPEEFSDFLEIVLSPIDYHQYSFVRGTVYRDVPDYPYDSLFIDGPDTQGMCNMDFVKLVESSESPIYGIIDGRRRTALAYSYLFGGKKIVYYRFGFSYLGPFSKRDLLSKINLMDIFRRNIKVYGGAPFKKINQAKA